MSYQYRIAGKKPAGKFRRVFSINPGDFIKFPLGKEVYQVVAIFPGFRFKVHVKTVRGVKKVFSLSAMKRLQIVPGF